jgi:hypothetical protein
LREKYNENIKVIFPNNNDWTQLPKKILENLTKSEIKNIHEEYRKTSLEYIWSNIRYDNWPKNPPKNFHEYINYDCELKKEIESTFNNFSGNYYHNEFESYDENIFDEADFIWDTNWYFCKEKTISNIEKIYNQFGLSDYNEKYVTILYNMWIEKNNTITTNSRL